MQNALGRVAVRLTLWSLLAATVVATLAPTVEAQDAAPYADVTFTPIITDGAGDAADFWDILELAVGEPGDGTLVVRITADTMPASAPLPTSPAAVASIDFFFTAAGTAQRAAMNNDGSARTVYTACQIVAGVGYCILPYDTLKVAVGDQITATHAASYLGTVVDYAPSADPSVVGNTLGGTGSDYTLTGCTKAAGCGGPPAVPGDADGDGLNDTCELKYFGNLTAQNATGDPDHDGLTNAQECNAGTDPTKADTDGDGTNDKDDPFPTDPSKGGATNSTSSSSSSSTSHTGSSSSSSSASSSSQSSSSSSTGVAAGSGKTKGAPKDFSEAMDRLSSDPGYLGLSSGGFLAVLILCIIGLAVRWSL